ncbi:MAG: glucose-1-phosphate adenylyltransferase, partial [Maioricimonas sp. JB049]
QDDRRAQCVPDDVPPLGIGAGSVIERAIVDKDCRIGRNVTIRLPEGAAADGEHGPLLIRDGIVVVPKGTALPDGWSF